MFNKSLIIRNLSNISRLTKNRYPNLKRGSYESVTDRHVSEFENIVGKNRILTSDDDVQPFNEDILKMVCGSSRLVIKPKTTKELSAIIKICNRDGLAVCPQGGNTSVVGGSVPLFDEIIISMSLMNKIINIDSLSETLSCEAGCIVENINTELEKYNLMLPYDLASRGSCQIGGNISTCAGGLRLLRYGNFQKSILGLEVVLPDGNILNCMNALKKDNTGYHLKQLFIGSEGTLGIVTAAILLCAPRPSSVNLAVLGLDHFSDVIKTMKIAKEYLSDIISSFELMDSESMSIVTSKLDLKSPLDPYNFYIFVETHGKNEKHDSIKLSAFLDEIMKQNLIKDGITTGEPSRIKKLWSLRERITEALTKDTLFYSYDLSLSVNEDFYEIINEMKDRLKEFTDVRVSCVAHLGDGNLHINITSKEYDKKLLQQMEPYIYERILHRKGSISAEHGVGFLKRNYLKYSKTKESISIMEQLKEVIDQKKILNPYKIFS